MKRFKIGFLAIVAILAISLTAATNADNLTSKGSTFDVKQNCYTQLTLGCNIGVVLTKDLTTCAQAFARVGAPIQAKNAVANVDCDDEQVVFCCATIEEDLFPCLGQPLFTFVDCHGDLIQNKPAQICEVYCKTAP